MGTRKDIFSFVFKQVHTIDYTELKSSLTKFIMNMNCISDEDGRPASSDISVW
jgi:hypothetical protein